jgi:hypothetical protein
MEAVIVKQLVDWKKQARRRWRRETQKLDRGRERRVGRRIKVRGPRSETGIMMSPVESWLAAVTDRFPLFDSCWRASAM